MKRVLLVSIGVFAMIALFIFTVLEKNNFKDDTGTIYYAVAVMEYAESPLTRVFTSSVSSIQNYFLDISQTQVPLNSKIDDSWIFRITFTDTIFGLGTDTITIPASANTMVVLVGENSIQIDDSAYQTPADTDMVSFMEYRFQNANEGTYYHFHNQRY